MAPYFFLLRLLFLLWLLFPLWLLFSLRLLFVSMPFTSYSSITFTAVTSSFDMLNW